MSKLVKDLLTDQLKRELAAGTAVPPFQPRGYYAAYAKGLANPPKKAVAS
jgi:hypothetical protein